MFVQYLKVKRNCCNIIINNKNQLLAFLMQCVLVQAVLHNYCDSCPVTAISVN